MAARRKILSTEQVLTKILDSSDNESNFSEDKTENDLSYCPSPVMTSADLDDSHCHAPTTTTTASQSDEDEESGREESTLNVSEDLFQEMDEIPEDLESLVSDGDPSYCPNSDADDSHDSDEEIAVYNSTTAPDSQDGTGTPATPSTQAAYDDNNSRDLFQEMDEIPATPSTQAAYDDNNSRDMDDLPLPPPPDIPLDDLEDLDLPLPPPPPSNLDFLDFDLPLPPPPPPSMLMFPEDSLLKAKTPSRKRKRDEASWQRNVKSARYNGGLSKTYAGVEVRRSLKPPCSGCRRKCTSLFPEHLRLSIFKRFWGMQDKMCRRNFIVSHVISKTKGRSRGNSNKRSQSLEYTLPIDGSLNQVVCKTMFLHTLDVSDSFILYNLKNNRHNIVEAIPHPPAHNAISEARLDYVRNHINSFPKVESHYCRADSKREYLEASLNVRQMYRMYREREIENNRDPVSEFKYRDIFDKFNLAFHLPSKDKCDTCAKFDLLKTPSESEKQEQDAHLRRKCQARESKAKDKTDPNIVSAAFDLQQVITCPKLTVASAYYLRKLNIYNFTILNLGTLQGTCYTWNEWECNRGTNDIASCVWKWLEEREKECAKCVVFYSDCCGGQNRNRLMITALMKFLSSSTHIQRIEQKYFETGHSKNECDSMHSVIQAKYKCSEVILPSGYHEHMRKAQHKQPYQVNVLTYKDIMNFKSLNEDFMPKTAFNGILKIHHIVYEKEESGVFVSFSQEIGGPLEKRLFLKRGKSQEAFRRAVIPHAYDNPCGIDEQKKADLLRLAEFLPEDSRSFYQSL